MNTMEIPFAGANLRRTRAHGGGRGFDSLLSQSVLAASLRGPGLPAFRDPNIQTEGKRGRPDPSRRAKSNGTILVAFRKRHSTAKIVISFSSF